MGEPPTFDLGRLGERNLVDHPYAREAARKGAEYTAFDYRYYDDPSAVTGYQGYTRGGNGNEGTRHFADEANLLVTIPGVRRVLDVGCAKGFFVAELRARGIETWGIDVSEYAIASAPPEIRPFLSVDSIESYVPPAEPFDLVHVDGVLLYLELTPLRRALRRIHEICRLGAYFEEPTSAHLTRLFDLGDPGAIDPLRRQELPAEAWDALYREAGFVREDFWYRKVP